MNSIFGLEREKGVSNILVGDCSISDAVHKTDIENLNLIPCGQIPPNPSELLGSKAMREMLATLGRSYERIVIDSPPITAVTDAVVLSKAVDGVVVVLQANKTERVLAKRAIEQMQAVNAHIFRIILNRLDERMTKYYHLYSYFYRDYSEEKKLEEKSHRKFWKMKENKRKEKERRKTSAIT
jgi:capsular exopolysaccharide synthesis family protein